MAETQTPTGLMNTRWNTAAILCAVGVVILSVTGILGYLPGLQLFASFRKDYIPMAPSTAVCFILISTTLLYVNLERTSLFSSRMALSVAVLVSVFGLLDVVGFFTGMELNFEAFLVPEFGTLNTFPIGRMSPATAMVFLFSGAALISHILEKDRPAKRRQMSNATGGLGLAILMASFVFCLSYLYGAPLLYDSGTTIPMALTTALGFLLFSVSLLSFRPDMFPMSQLSGSGTKNFLLRFMLPLAVFSVILGGITVLSSLRLLKLNPAIVSAGLAGLVVILSTIASAFMARQMGMVIDNQKKLRESEQALIQSENQFRTLYETMAQGVVYQNAHGEITDANPSAERILGLTLDQMKGRMSIDPRWKAVDQDMKDLSGDQHPSMVALATGKEVRDFVQGIFNPRLNEYVWILVTSVPQFRDKENEVRQVYSTFLDVTKRRNAEIELQKIKNNLEIQVEERTAELREKVIKLDKSQTAMLYMVEDLNRITKELKKERHKLRLSNQELESFAYSVSHDLRAPLRAIDGFSRFLTEDYADQLDDEGKRFIDIIRQNTAAMDRLISDLLDLSRVSRVEMNIVQIDDMGALAESIYHETATEQEKKIFELAIDKLPPVSCDIPLIKQVWQNLIGNALKYSARSSVKKISIRAEEAGNDVIFCIKDHGAGFDQRYENKLFGAFQRLHKDSEFKGTGVGLAIVQRVIQRHGGKVWAEGKVDEGAAFYFSLPRP